MPEFTLIEADCIEAMASMDEASVDAIVTDPPYGLEFMGKEWDRLTVHGFTDGAKRVQAPSWSRGGWQNKRCRKCGHIASGGSPCRCDEPEWEIEGGKSNASALASQSWHHAWAIQALRVLKPGGHLLAFGGTRTYHRLACALEDAGFEIRDCLCWLYGSGFPKSLDVSKAIDKRPGAKTHAQFAAYLAERREALGLSRADVSERVVGTRSGACWNWEHHQFPEAKWWPALRDLLGLDEAWGAVIAEAERAVVGSSPNGFGPNRGASLTHDLAAHPDITAPATPEAQRWQGWGTALKPAFEPIVLARKPLDGTVAGNVTKFGTGALNIDGTRIGTDPGWTYPKGAGGNTFHGQERRTDPEASSSLGRWPANVLLGHSPDCKPTGKTRRVKASQPASGPTLSQRDSAIYEMGWNGERGEIPNYADEDGTETIEVWDCVPDCPVALLDEQSGDTTRWFNKSRDGDGRTGRELFGEHRGSGAAPSLDEGGASRYFKVIKPEEGQDERSTGSSDQAVGGGAVRDSEQAVNLTQRGAGIGDAADGTSSPSRFRYVAKADREERNRGLGHRDEFPAPNAVGDPDNPTRTRGSLSKPRANLHPTVKPVELMQWLCRLITPPKGTILDPFCGSGSTGMAALREGFDFIGIEREAEYVEIARDRIIGDGPMFNVEALILEPRREEE